VGIDLLLIQRRDRVLDTRSVGKEGRIGVLLLLRGLGLLEEHLLLLLLLEVLLELLLLLLLLLQVLLM